MNPDDPKFTAYALDEIDPAERAEVEQMLRENADAAAEVEATRLFATQLRARLHAEPAVPLHDVQRAEILAAHTPQTPRNVIAFTRRTAAWTALAASIAVGAGYALLFPALNEMKPRPIAHSGQGRASIRDGGDVKVALDAPLEVTTAPAPALAPIVAGGSVTTTDHPFVLADPLSDAGKISLNNPTQPIATAPFLSMAASAPVTAVTGAVASTASDPLSISGGTVVPANPASAAPESMRGRMGGLAKAKVLSETRAKESARGGRRQLDAYSATSQPAKLSTLDALSDDPRSYYRFDRDEAEMARPEPPGTESYDDVTDNPFRKATAAPLSTFSIDVDTASYANARRFLNNNQLPPKASVRIEELINYFHYDYPQPEGDAPFSSAMEVATCPWAPEHRLLRIGLHGREIQRAARPASNLVFLVDVSGSMQPENKLPLLKRSLALMVDQLTERDRVSIVVYAGAAGVVLDSTHSKERIRKALAQLESGGSTHGSAGIQLAYELAEKHFIKGGTNRVILATDGDWNVGVTDKGDLTSLIERKAKSGVFLTVLGFGMDNLKDDMLEKLADKGNGNYAYIDTLNEGRKVLVEELGATLITIAKDVKIQIEFNPAQVGAYRLIGYENRVMAAKDFADDSKDAGEIGAGHSVTALYEIIPAGRDVPAPVQPAELKYQKPAKTEAPSIAPALVSADPASKELLTLKLRYKTPDGDKSTLREYPLVDRGQSFANSSRDFRFAAAVAGYGMLLRGSEHRGSANWNLVHELATEGKGDDRDGYRAEFVGLVEKARALQR